MVFPVKTLSYECAEAFAVTRHEGLSLSFLKENGELLSIALSCGLTVSEQTLELYSELYDKIDKLCELYRPFFRFFLAIALDLEDLGMPGNKGEKLIDYVHKSDLYAYDTSDTRRLEIINLLNRRGRKPQFKTDTHEALLNRVTGFLQQPEKFIKFNRPLFYEYTHLVFFVTDYGKKQFNHDDRIFKSLNQIGMLAYLDNDTDLLAEVCLCFTFLGRPAPQMWVEECSTGLKTMDISFKPHNALEIVPPADDYHIYFVMSWLMGVLDKDVFQEIYSQGVPIFTQHKPQKSTLSKIFQVLHPLVLDSPAKQTRKHIRASEFLSVEDTLHLHSALAVNSNSGEFFDKLTHGYISAA